MERSKKYNMLGTETGYLPMVFLLLKNSGLE